MTAKKQVLVVEDNELNREILIEILADQYAVLQAENGQEALEILQRNKDSISLILLDVMMPVMDGFTLLNIIKADPDLSLIPVIVTTQGNSEADEVTALTHGATDFVPKPYRPRVILHRVASLIKLRETAAMVNQLQFDRLTGLFTKEYFYQKVRQQLLADPEGTYCIIGSNVENFKLYNDTFGIPAGDRLLRQIADMGRRMVEDSGFCGRFTADRFLIFQRADKERADREALGRVMEAQTVPTMKNAVMRWGIYEIIDRTVPVEQMCDRALLAADSIKGQFDQFVAVYDDALRGKLLREKAITDAMATALEEGQFTVYLQPKYSLREECMTGAEALVRWKHPQWGIVSPGEFIPLFEKNGFIRMLDRYIWEQVCRLLRDWKQQGRTPLPLSVNVSRADVFDDHLADTLLELTRQYGVEPGLLHLEITESAYSENTERIIGTTEQLRKLGFVMEMDDFGSGYSSLNMLSRMKLDVLKLDMKFIQNEMDKPAELSILNDIINMAHRMGLSVVAEGVETREQMKYLQMAGCDYVQGYFFARPMPIPEFEELWMAQRRRYGDRPKDQPCRESRIPGLLVADEDAGFRQIVRHCFEGQYRVEEAADADTALECVRKEEGAISAVILSSTLPENGAAAVIKAMREDPVYWEIPILATISAGDRVDQLPLATKADDFLCKQHPAFDLCRRVRHLEELASAHRREIALQNEAQQDFLTGLLNRRGLHAALESLRGEDLPLAVYLFDLDDMKKVNDSYGHDMGDRMIHAFAELLRSQTRAGDILCRYGGDEFVVILKHFGSGEEALKKGNRICQLFNECLSEEQITASCSGGVTLCPPRERPSLRLVERADRALYMAKRENKCGCRLFEDTETAPSQK